MVQRLGLAQTLLHDPDIYILDEPMSGLDPLGRALVKDILRDLKEKGKTIFFSTHITSDVETVCDRVGVIVGGELLAVDHVESILRRGIEGYHVQIRCTGPVDEVFQGYAMREGAMGIKEIIVPKAMFREFLAKVSVMNVEIELIEPKRKNLESFFLEIVEKHAS
jgi:ABC-2 type transport system ATP-binding protein